MARITKLWHLCYSSIEYRNNGAANSKSRAWETRALDMIYC